MVLSKQLLGTPSPTGLDHQKPRKKLTWRLLVKMTLLPLLLFALAHVALTVGRVRPHAPVPRHSCTKPADVLGLTHCPVGFAENTTGGGGRQPGTGGEVYYVTSLRDDTQPGSLRHAVSRRRPLWIAFNVSGTILLSKPLPIASNKTLDGRSQRVVITGSGIQIKNSAGNIIILSLIFWRGEADAIQIKRGAKNIWIDQCTIGRWKDGAIDITRGASLVTVSRTLFHHHNKVMLVGSQPDFFSLSTSKDTELLVSLHNNWFVGTTQRHPRVVAGKVHVFNNVYQTWLLYAIGVTCSGQVYSESNHFIAGRTRHASRIFDKHTWPGKRGRLRSVGDLLLRGAVMNENEPDEVFLPRDYYNYTVKPASRRTLVDIAGNAGWKQGTTRDCGQDCCLMSAPRASCSGRK